MKKVFLLALSVILIAPMVLQRVYDLTDQRLDVPLKGNLDLVEKPDAKWDAFLSGEYQSGMTA